MSSIETISIIFQSRNRQIQLRHHVPSRLESWKGNASFFFPFLRFTPWGEFNETLLFIIRGRNSIVFPARSAREPRSIFLTVFSPRALKLPLGRKRKKIRLQWQKVSRWGRHCLPATSTSTLLPYSKEYPGRETDEDGRSIRERRMEQRNDDRDIEIRRVWREEKWREGTKRGGRTKM